MDTLKKYKKNTKIFYYIIYSTISDTQKKYKKYKKNIKKIYMIDELFVFYDIYLYICSINIAYFFYWDFGQGVFMVVLKGFSASHKVKRLQVKLLLKAYDVESRKKRVKTGYRTAKKAIKRE